MMVSHGQKGYSGYCFKCGASEFSKHADRSLSELQAAREARERLWEPEDGDVRLPRDFTLDIPADASPWLTLGGVGPDLAHGYGIGYSPSLDRVVIPVYWDGKLTSVQARAIRPWQKPKYINPKGVARTAVLKSRSEFMLPSANPLPDVCVLVEDGLSAIRVGRLQPAYAALGTSLSDRAILDIISTYKTVILWLDGDAAGQEAKKSIRQQLHAYGLKVLTIVTEKDPKRLTNEEIRNNLYAGHHSPANLSGS